MAPLSSLPFNYHVDAWCFNNARGQVCYHVAEILGPSLSIFRYHDSWKQKKAEDSARMALLEEQAIERAAAAAAALQADIEAAAGSDT